MSSNQMIENMSMGDYRANDAYSSSDIISIGRSAAKWMFEKNHPKNKTRAMQVGSATHLMIQSEVTGQKHLVSSGLAVYEDGSSKTKGFEKFAAEHPSAYSIDSEEYDLVCRMTKAVLSEPEAMRYLKGAVPEPSLFCMDPEFEFMRKCRPDFLHIKQGVSINVKTTLDASEKGFFRSIADRSYDFQTVNYQDILRLYFDRSFDEIHILVEKSDAGPCRVAIRGIDDDTLDQARFQMRQVFQKIVDCQKSGKWEDEKAALIISNVPLWSRTIVGL